MSEQQSEIQARALRLAMDYAIIALNGMNFDTSLASVKTEDIPRIAADICNNGRGRLVALLTAESERDELKKEIGEFQNDAKALIDGIAETNVDGAGSDTGRWQDFTIAEIGMGLNKLKDDCDQLRADLAKANAQLSERKTVHEWLNTKSIPTTEYGKPICLLRRLRIALDTWQTEPLAEIEKVRSDLATAKAENVVLRDAVSAMPVARESLRQVKDLANLNEATRNIIGAVGNFLNDALRTLAEKGVVL